MTKIVYNGCYGGFSVSEAGMLRYAELKGFPIYPEQDAKFGIVTYWRVPPELRQKPLEGAEWYERSQAERIAYNKRYSEQTISARDFVRHDPALVQVVEELGDAANGRHAKLTIAEVESGRRYRIDEYDGIEGVMTADDYEWTVAP